MLRFGPLEPFGSGARPSKPSSPTELETYTMRVSADGSNTVQPFSSMPLATPPSEPSSRVVQPRSYCQSTRPSLSLSTPSLHSQVPKSHGGAGGAPYV